MYSTNLPSLSLHTPSSENHKTYAAPSYSTVNISNEQFLLNPMNPNDQISRVEGSVHSLTLGNPTINPYNTFCSTSDCPSVVYPVSDSRSHLEFSALTEVSKENEFNPNCMKNDSFSFTENLGCDIFPQNSESSSYSNVCFPISASVNQVSFTQPSIADYFASSTANLPLTSFPQYTCPSSPSTLHSVNQIPVSAVQVN